MLRSATALFAICLLFPFSGPAWAASYAALDEHPAEGGELRLVRPIAYEAVTPDGAPTLTEVIGFPLEHTRVHVDVDGPMAQVTVEQTFANPFPEPIEAVYVFPLSDDAAVNDYEMVIGERTVRGRIQTREEARRTYEKARGEGRTAGLLEQEKANVFTQSLANIPPGEPIVVRFRYVEAIAPQDGVSELVYPLTIGPRYLPAGNTERRPVAALPRHAARSPGVVGVRYATPTEVGRHQVDISVDLDPGVPLMAVESPSHQVIETRTAEASRSLSLAPTDRIPNRDFILRWRTAGERTLFGTLAHRTDSDGYFTLVVQPKAEYRTGDITPREVVLLIDRSGSMSGEPLAHAKEVSRAILGTLGDKDVFNLIAFADGTDELSPRPTAGDAAGVARGLRWLDALQAGGGTEMAAGVARSLARPPGEDRLRIIYLLTDGFVGNDDAIISMVRRTTGFNRVFSIGIGSAPNRSLLDRVAEEGRGFARYVTRAEEAGPVATDLVERSAYPYLADVEIDWGSLQVEELIPERIPDVYAGQPLVVSGRYRRPGDSEIRIRATVAGRRVETPLKVELPKEIDRPGVRHLWARRRIHELGREQYDGEKPSVRSEITRLGLEFGLVTEYTSFVAVDETRVVDGSGRTRTVVQPVAMPADVSHETTLGESYAPPATPPRRRSRRGPSFDFGSSGGGGDVDPITILTVLSILPLARTLRRRRRAGPPGGDDAGAAGRSAADDGAGADGGQA